MSLTAGTRLGSYEILGALGAGGMGEVYRASDRKLKREVAIKVMPETFARDEERMKRFEREAQVLASLNHPNVAAIYGLEEADGIRALVLELVEGPTLSERIARGPIPLEEALRIAVQIAHGLEAAHEKAVIHRDLKPANVKLTKDGDVKILDLGLAKALEVESPPVEDTNSPTLTRATQTGVLLGTAAYMSPEQAKGKSADRRADVWAFGVVLYEMLAGSRAFDGEDVSETLAFVLTKEPDWSALPGALPPRVGSMLRRCLTKDPKRRLQAIGEARIAIEEPGEDAPTTERSVWPVLTGVLGLALGLAIWAVWPRSAPSPAPPMRLSVELGADAPLFSNPWEEGQGVLLSPDGTLLVFVALPSPGALPQLYVRRLEALEASLLLDTEGARNPFLSPDGQWIAFFAEEKLKKVAVNGGGAVNLADVSVVGYHGGTWAADGTIVFAQDQGGGVRLMRVSSAGGTPEALTIPDQDGGNQSWPQALPGGKGVLYTSATGTSDEATIVFQPLPSGPRKTLVQGGYHGRYLPSGHLVYIREGALFAVAFDLDRLEVIGKPARAVASVLSTRTTRGAQFASSDRGVLAYVPSLAAESTLQWVDRSGNRKSLRDIPGIYNFPKFSPDGRVLAMDIVEGSERDLWAYEWEGDRLTRLTFDPSWDSRPVWTPDGRRIVFASTRGDKKTRNLYWQRADGTGEAERLTESENAQWPGSWDRSGKLLAFSELNGTRPDVMILPLEGSEEQGWKPGKPRTFFESSYVDNNPEFSPDGRWLAYMSNKTGRFEIYVRPFPGPGGMWQISTESGRLPVWSRVRRELFYYANDQRIMVVPYTVDGDEFRAAKPRRWSDDQFAAPPDTFLFDVHPDGERFAVVTSLLSSSEARRDRVVFILNFFDYLRQIAPAQGTR